jgi:hypothetical protein
MYNADQFIQAEVDYRRSRIRSQIAASRSGRSRSSWARRVAAANKSVS